MNNIIPTRLKTAREKEGLTVEQVVAMLSSRGHSISAKTLYGYENGVSSPKISIFMALCEIYGISDLLGEFGYGQISSPAPRLSAHEIDLVLAYRKQPQSIKDFISQSLGLSIETTQSKNA